MSLYPPFDLLRLYFIVSHLEHERALVGLYKPPPVTLLYDRLHLQRYDILIFALLADTRLVLLKSANALV